MTIRVIYSSVDGFLDWEDFKLIEDASQWARDWIGDHPEIGRHGYAVSGDGIGKIEVVGAQIADLFPPRVGEAA